MKRTIILTLLLVCTLLLGAACGTTTTTPAAPADSAPAAAVADPTEKPKDDTNGGAPAAPAGDVVPLVWIMGDPGKVPPDLPAVQAAMDKLSAEAVGVTVNTLFMDNEQAKRAISAGDYFDIAYTCEWYNDYAVQANDGIFADLTDKLPTVTPDLYNFIPELVWKGSKVNGKIFAIPVYKDTAAAQYWRFDKALVDELSLDITKYNTFASIEEAFAKVKEAKPDAYPLISVKVGVGIDYGYNMINRTVGIGLSYADKNTTVVSTFEHPEWIENANLVRKWNQAGYINPDCMTLETAPKYAAIKGGQGFPGADSIWSAGDGYEQVITKYYGPVMSTASIRGAMNGISAASNHIDKALAYMQYVNTDRTYRDMLKYGIEGQNFEYTADKQSVKILNDGYQPWGFSQGTFFNLTPEAPMTISTWEEVKAENDLAAQTTDPSTIGFTFNPEDVSAEIAACTVIVEKFRPGFHNGALDVETELPKFIKELESAGYRTIIEEAQKQLDAFIAENK